MQSKEAQDRQSLSRSDKSRTTPTLWCDLISGSPGGQLQKVPHSRGCTWPRLGIF